MMQWFLGFCFVCGVVANDVDSDLLLIQLQAQARQAGGESISEDARAATKTPDGKLHHILFIFADDLRPEFSAYGHPEVRTPNMQKLANHGFTFNRAYVQQAVCGPSRTAILTGRRPDSSRIWGNTRNFRETTGKDWRTLPQFFRENGWRSIGIGKIYHETMGQDEMLETNGGSWSVKHKTHGDDHCPYNPKAPGGVPSVKGVNAPWNTFRDGKHAVLASEWIRNASKYDEPFFLAVGFHLPHIPYIYPKEYEFTGDLNFPPKNWYITKDLPSVALHDWTDEGALFSDLRSIQPRLLQSPQGQNKSSLCTAIPVSKQAEMKLAYLSSVQYIDHLIGEMLQTLVNTNLYDQTTVIMLGDHGYKLGEHCEWFKHDNYELSNRFPLIVKPASHVAKDKGRMVDEIVESVDIYPSLVDLVGLDVPEDLEGQSMMPLMKSRQKKGKTYALSQYPHWDMKYKWCMGYSIRSKGWRYTEWLKFDCKLEEPMSNCADKGSITPRWDEVCGVELYDHRTDTFASFVDFENENLAQRPEFAFRVQYMHDELMRFWSEPSI